MTAGLVNKCVENDICMTSQRHIIPQIIEGAEDYLDVDQLYQRAVE